MPQSDRILTPAGLLAMMSTQNRAKRLSFRVDPADFETIYTRIDALVDAVADIHRIDRATFRKAGERDTDLIFAQQLAWWVLRTRFALPFEVIAGYFEHHRSTISKGVRTVQDATEIDPTFAAFVETLPFWVNMDFEQGRIHAISAVLTAEVGTTIVEAVKMPPRARKGAKTGIVEQSETEE